MSTVNTTAVGLNTEVTITIQIKSTNEGDQDYTFSLTNTSQTDRLMRTMSLSTNLAGAQSIALSSGTKFLVSVPTTGSANLFMTGSTNEAGMQMSTVLPGFFPVATTAVTSPLFYQVGGGSFLLRVTGF
jgi:hypothetical protein